MFKYLCLNIYIFVCFFPKTLACLSLEIMFYHPASIILLLLATFHFKTHFVSHYEMKSLTHLSVTKGRSRPADENSSLIIRLSSDWHHNNSDPRLMPVQQSACQLTVQCTRENYRLIGPKPCSAKKSKMQRVLSKERKYRKRDPKKEKNIGTVTPKKSKIQEQCSQKRGKIQEQRLFRLDLL